MRDPLDNYLRHLPGETAAPDLAARIGAAVAERRRARVMWRRIGVVTCACALLGGALVLISWSHVVETLVAPLIAVDVNSLARAVDTLLASPSDTFTAWMDAGLTWQAAQAEGIGLVFTFGVALLSAAAFGGLAQLLNQRGPSEYSH